MISKLKKWNWWQILNSAIIIAFLVPVLNYTKGIYDIAIVDHAYRVTDHNEWLNMKSELTANNNLDKLEHQQLKDKCADLKADVTTSFADITVIQTDIEGIKRFIKYRR